jgi:hypothetical protein
VTRITVKGPFQKDQNRPTHRSWSPGRGKMSPFLSPTAVPLPALLGQPRSQVVYGVCSTRKYRLWLPASGNRLHGAGE